MNQLTSISLIFTLFLALTHVGPSTCYSLDEAKNTGLKNESPTKIFAAYRESYITKNDAKKFRQRIKNHKKPYMDKDYEDLIQEIHYKPKQQPKQAMYEKKYFDYLPADMLENAFKETKGVHNTDATKVEFMEIEDFAKLHQARNKSRRTNSRRMRRQAGLYPFGYSQEILYHTPVVYHVVPHPIYNRAIQPSSYPAQSNLVQSYVPVVTDWGRQPYLPPRPDRGYLPTVTGPKKPMRNPAEPGKNPMKTPSKKPDGGGTINRFDLDGMEVLVFENAKDDRPKFSRFPGQASSTPVRTTTRKPGRTPPPSIFHNSNDYDDDNTVVANKRPATSSPPTTQRPNAGGNRQRTTTRRTTGRTPPPLFHTVDYDDDVANVVGRNPETTRRPSNAQPSTTTTEPTPVTARPSQCTWAIVNCCTNVRSNTRYSCFESHGCSGFFFGVNPCTRQVVDAAFEETEKYFN